MMNQQSTSQFPSRFIRAGAGAGKTTTLINTFFDFVDYYREKNQKYPRIIITTFTRKATQEVKERLLHKALALDAKSPSSGSLELFQYINKKSMVHISTIHGVLSLMLSKNHDLLGLSSDLKVCDQKTLYKIYYRELKSLFKSQPQYLELLEHFSFKDLVRLAMKFHESESEQEMQFVDQNVLLALRKQQIAGALKDIELILKEAPTVAAHKPWSAYFDFIRAFYTALKHEPTSVEQLQVLYKEKPRKPVFSADKPIFDAGIHDLVSKYFSSDSDFISFLDSDEFIATHQAVNKLFHQLALTFHTHIIQYKKRSGQISISDLETLSLKLIQDYPIAVQAFSDQYDYFMVDEYQDTSPLQVKILNALLKNKPQFTVGDPQQSIYLFRGARSEVFLSKEQEVQQKGHELIRLDTNYRSDHRLMNGLNAITGNFSSQFLPMIPKADQEETSDLSTQVYYVKAADEYEGIIHHILHLVQQGVQFGDICVLFTKNNDIFDFAKTALRHNIPVQSLIAAGFDQKREILDLVAFLKFLVNPYDNLNLLILLRSPWFEITDEELVLLRQSSAQSAWSQLKQNQHPATKDLTDYLMIYQQNGVMEALEKFILKSQFLKNSLRLDPTGKREANIYKFIANLQESLESEQFILNDYLSLQFSSFQEDLSSNLNESMALFSGNRVSVMTIHGAKGLQFKHVIVPGVCARPKATYILQFLVDHQSGQYSIPVMGPEMKLTWSAWGKQQRQLLNQKEYLEYERLFYVAITRAQKSISFVWDTSSRTPTAGSWCTKMQWPAPGVHHFENYTAESLEYEGPASIYENPSATAYMVNEKIQSSADQLKDGSSTDTVSVTELISQDAAAEASMFPVQADKAKNEKIIESLGKAQMGTDLHRLFESLKYLPEAQVMSRASAADQRALKWLFSLKEIPFKEILEVGHTEWGFGLQTRMGILQGQIDLWAKLDKTIYILDYKTGSSAYADKAFQQLHRYAESLKKMNMIKSENKICLAVLYASEQKLILQEASYTSLADI